MKTLRLCAVICATLLLFSCSKNIRETEDLKKEQTNHPEAGFFSLPSNAIPVQVILGNGKKLSLYQADTNYYLQRDMVLTPSQIAFLKAPAGGQTARSFSFAFYQYWMSGIVPYTIKPGFTTAQQSDILSAMSDWQSATPGLHFVVRTNAHADYIEFNPSTTVSNSNVGRIGGKQTINLNTTWDFFNFFRAARHEVGHALGMFHEHSRGDRDNFITINWANIKPGYHYDFRSYTENGLPGMDIGTFDFNSVMLYGSMQSADVVYDTNIPAMTTNPGGTTWGGNLFISAGDGQTGSLLYGPPYGRVRYEYTGGDDNGQTLYNQSAIWLDFFQDEACTIPATLNEGRTIRLRNFTQTFQRFFGFNYGYTYSTTTLAAGSSSYYLGDDYYTEVYDGSMNTLSSNYYTTAPIEGFVR